MSRSIGREGEELACEYLKNLKYQILARNYYSRFGEIDIVAKKDKIIRFIEVKFRENQGFGLPEEAVTAKKVAKILKTARIYLSENELNTVDWQIDVLAIEKKAGHYEIFENIYTEGAI